MSEGGLVYYFAHLCDSHPEEVGQAYLLLSQQTLNFFFEKLFLIDWTVLADQTLVVEWSGKIISEK